MSDKEIIDKLTELSEKVAKSEVERENMINEIAELKQDVKEIKTLAEDVHIMALSMQNMKETLSKTSEKVDKLANKQFEQYEENKKIFKNSTLSAIFGAVGTAIVGFLVWFVSNFMGK